MSMCKNITRLAQPIRQISSSSAARSSNIPEGYKKLAITQAKFQVADGQPIFLKGGAVDKVLYGTTVVLSVAGLAGIGKLIYDLSFPKVEE